MDYKEAGVNIEEGYRAVGKYREMAAATLNPSVLGGIGGFAGMYSLSEALGAGIEEPVIVSGTDGVGTKLDIAFRMKKYDTVGIDCVAMCVNDILCQGARPLFFLDYLACGKLDSDVAASIVRGIVRGCAETGSVLLGGETAEMPGFYEEGKYDIAGFSVGIVDRKKIIDGSAVKPGDILLGIASSGPHSNGFSLIRKVIPNLDEDFGGMSIGMALLEPTRLYVKPILELLKTVPVHGMAHITGGGFYENIPRLFAGRNLSAVIVDGSWPVSPVFARIEAGVSTISGAAGGGCAPGGCAPGGENTVKTKAELKKLMFNTYNMGIGFVLAISPNDKAAAVSILDDRGFPAWEIGRVEEAGEKPGLFFEGSSV